VRRLLFYSDTITTTVAGQPVVITHTLVNDGDITETVTLTVSSPLAGWGVA